MTEINKRIEKVKKILVENLWHGQEPHSLELFDDTARQICQLFPQPLDDEKSREKSLLTPEEIRAIPFYKLTPDYALPYSVIKAQQDKDFALLQQKIRQERERIELIIDSYMAHGKYKVLLDGVLVNGLSADMENVWEQIKQALKKGESDK